MGMSRRKFTKEVKVLAIQPMIPNIDMFVAGMCLNFLPKAIPAKERDRLRIGAFLIGAALFFYVAMGIFARALPHLHLKIETFWAFGSVFGVLFASIFIRFSEKLGIVLVRKRIFGQILFFVQWIGTLRTWKICAAVSANTTRLMRSRLSSDSIRAPSGACLTVANYQGFVSALASGEFPTQCLKNT
jgi:predicted membrane protein